MARSLASRLDKLERLAAALLLEPLQAFFMNDPNEGEETFRAS